MTRTVTARDMEALRAAVAADYPDDNVTELVVNMKWDWLSTPGPALIWEGGPYEWAIECSIVRKVANLLGLWVEPQNSFALCVYVQESPPMVEQVLADHRVSMRRVPPVDLRRRPEQRYVTRPIGPCPCECNRGGFCGGCGHAGCGGR